MDTTIEWNSDGSGYLKQGKCRFTVFRRPVWLRNKIWEMITDFVWNPKFWDAEKRTKISEIPFRNSRGFANEHPRFTLDERILFQKDINRRLDDILPELQAELMDEEIESLSDFQFLCHLTMKRNWKSGCAICLTDKIMGTTCTCGHTEIAVFRPCGHSMCASPCFENFMASTGQRFRLYSMSGVKTDISQVEQFECPYCRCIVNKVISAENTYCDETFEKVIDAIFTDIHSPRETPILEQTH